MGESAPRVSTRTVAWIVGVALAWPAWIWICELLGAYVLGWAQPITPEPAQTAGVAGLFDTGLQLTILAFIGFAFGFLGTYLLMRVRAPRSVWIPAAVVSVAHQAVRASFWALFSGYGTGWRNVTESFVIAVVLGLIMGLGAWLGARLSRALPGPVIRPEATPASADR